MGQSPEEQQLTDDIAATRDDLSRNLDALTDRVSPGRIVERRKEAVRGGFYRVREGVMGAAPSLSGTTDSVKGSVSGTAQGAVDTMTERAQGNPLAAGLIAFGAGALIGSLIPASDKEARASQRLVEVAKEQAQPMVEEAKSVGQEMGQHLKDQAGEAAQEVKATAAQAAENVKDEGRSSAQTVKDDAQSSAQTVKDTQGSS